MSDALSRMRILEMIENHQVTPEEGILLLQGLSAGEELEKEDELPAVIDLDGDGRTQGEQTRPAAPAPPAAGTPEGVVSRPPEPASPSYPVLSRAWLWWAIPLGVGVLVTVSSALLMFRILETSGAGFWFFFSILPLLVGVAIMVLAIQSRGGPWLHLRVSEGAGSHATHFTLSIPLPMRLAGWFLRTAGPHIEGLKNANIEAILLAMEGSLGPENPFYIDVDDEDGDHVEIYIG